MEDRRLRNLLASRYIHVIECDTWSVIFCTCKSLRIKKAEDNSRLFPYLFKLFKRPSFNTAEKFILFFSAAIFSQEGSEGFFDRFFAIILFQNIQVNQN